MTQDELREKNGRNFSFPIIFYDEIWKKIVIKDLKDIYWISNYGRVYNEQSGYIMQGHIVNNGYVVVSFRNIYNKRIYCHVHRVLMLTFYPIENEDKFVVNHIDGNKQHNFLWNLEWTTQKGNVKHAFDTGLRKCGEYSSHNIFTDQEVHSVCKYMEQGYDINQISEMVFHSTPTPQIKVLCINISNKKGWTHISSLYNIDNYRKGKVFSENEVRFICNSIENNPNISNDEILANMNIYPNDIRYISCNRNLSNIRLKKTRINITSNYNI